jgi:acetyl esterase/lipase
MNRLLILGVAWLLPWLSLCAAEKPITLWPDGAPGALGTSPKDIPTLTPYLPAKSSGAAMLLIPGGSYSGIYEGQAEPFALWLNEHGLTVFVLRYRLGSAGYRYPAQLQAAVEAMFQIRGNAEKWKIDPKRIGVMGFSAGGHLSSMAATLFDEKPAGMTNDSVDQVSARPDVAAPTYPVISMIAASAFSPGYVNRYLFVFVFAFLLLF